MPFHDETSMTAGFERVVGELVRALEILDKTGQAPRQRVLEKFTWDVKAEQIFRVYDQVISASWAGTVM